TENHKVPATILSRCQCYDFRRISLGQIAANLGKVASAEGITISPAALSWIAEAGDGSMRDAQSIFDQVIAYAGLNISDDDVENILGLADRKYLYRLSEAVLSRNAGACLTILEEAYLAGMDMKQFYSMLLRHFRNLLLVKIAADDSSSFDIPQELVEKLKGQTLNVSRETLQRYLDILLSEADSLRRSQEVRMKMETILIRMAYLEPVLPVGEILATLESMEQKLHNGMPSEGRTDPAPGAPKHSPTQQQSGVQRSGEGPRPKPAPVEAAIHHTGKPVSGDDLKKFIQKEKPPLGAKIEAAEVLGFENGCLTLGFPKGYVFLDNIMEKTQKEELERIAGIFYSQNVSLAVQTVDSPKTNGNGPSPRGNRTNNINNIRREAMNSPLFQKVLAQFEGAELIEIKPITDKKQGG
ncbi:MAG: hypothetical protein PHN98_10565, partial [Smithellaceae bacterium]|nr:hypothetical protein [Smithellaceae bacterium]